MRTNIDIDETLLKKAMKFSKIETKKELVNTLIKEYVLHKERMKIFDFRAENTWTGNLDQMRTYD